MPGSIPKYWVVLAVALVIAAGAAFYGLKPGNNVPKEEPQAPTAAAKLGVVNMEKVIEAHPNYPKWIKMKQQETVISQNMDISRQQFEKNAAKNFQALNQELGATLEQEFDVRMKAKQAELQKEFMNKTQPVRSGLEAEFEEYAKKLDEQYQTELFDLHLKLSVLQINEEQAKIIQGKMEKLKEERAEKLAKKSYELSIKMDEILAPELEKLNKEMYEYETSLYSELENKMLTLPNTGALPGVTGEALPETKESKELKEQMKSSRMESDALYETISKDARYRLIDVAVRLGLDAVVSGHEVNINAVDITDLVIEEFKK